MRISIFQPPYPQAGTAADAEQCLDWMRTGLDSTDLVLCPSYQRSETAGRIRGIAQTRSLDCGAYLARSSYAMQDQELGGRSLLTAPDGALLKDAGGEPCILTADFDPHHQFMKPASHGQDIVEHRLLIESHRRPATYRPRPERTRRIATSPFPRICAHRGLSQACPENTVPAFAAAMSMGAHELELDVRTSRDGTLVVCHDDGVDRTTNGSGEVAALDWDVIQRLDAGIRLSTAWQGVRIPCFEEVLELTDGRIGLNVHVKTVSTDTTIVRRVCDLLTEHALNGSAYIALDSEPALRAASEYAPDLPRACLASQQDPVVSIEIAERYACQRIQFSRHVTPKQIQRAHDLGLICNLFWSDDPQDGMTYVGNGIDVILTNCANVMIAGGFKTLAC